MEELQVIETTSGRQFKPWASKEDVQAIEQVVEQVVQDPASVTAIASEIASGKQAIAAAINAKGGSASVTESFNELADDVINLNDSFITYGVEVTEKMHWLKFICSNLAVDRLPLTGISSTEITSIRNYAFQSCTALESLDLPNLTTISGYAFQGCSSLQTLNLPNLTTIGDYSFSGCTALQTLDLPNLNTIAGSAFYSCTSLQTLDLPNLNTIAGSAFFNCTSLQTLNSPNLTSIGNFALQNCGAVKNITLGRLTSYSEFLTSAKPNLRNITIGQDTNVNLQFQNWNATSVIGEQGGVDELNSNLQTNLISKLYQGGGKILRLGAALYDVTTQETRDMVTAKGWTLQRG